MNESKERSVSELIESSLVSLRVAEKDLFTAELSLARQGKAEAAQTVAAVRSKVALAVSRGGTALSAVMVESMKEEASVKANDTQQPARLPQTTRPTGGK